MKVASKPKAATRPTPKVIAPPAKKVAAATGLVVRELQPPPQVAEVIDHPAHYHQGTYETINVIEAWELGFHLGNAVKYIARAGKKGSRVDDLRKAKWYIDRELSREGAA